MAQKSTEQVLKWHLITKMFYFLRFEVVPIVNSSWSNNRWRCDCEIADYIASSSLHFVTRYYSQMSLEPRI